MKITNDKLTTVSELRNKIQNFSKDKGWERTENTKDLVMALSVEASELLEIFQWVHSNDADKVKEDTMQFEHLQEEISNVFWYLIRICNHYDIDLTTAINSKAIKNAKKYPTN